MLQITKFKSVCRADDIDAGIPEMTFGRMSELIASKQARL